MIYNNQKFLNLKGIPMAIRWRKSGELLCAAMTEAQEGDRYIDDDVHYQLSVVQRCIIADAYHEKNGLWHWVHQDYDDPKSYRLRDVPEQDVLKELEFAQELELN